MPKKIIMTGGGTAGHVMPNLALIPYLKEYFDEFHYIGSKEGIEKAIIAKFPFIEYHEIPCIKLIRSLSPKNLKIPFVLASGIKAAKKLIKEIEPNVIFSKGGYVALPVVKAAGKIPVVCHESDISMGLANRLSSKKCETICTSFETAAHSIKNAVYTGAPLRSSIYLGKHLGLRLNSKLPVVLIMGGSLGAKAINECVRVSLESLLLRYNVIHIAGKGNLFEKTTQLSFLQEQNIANNLGYFHQLEFAENIEDFYATADLVVSRGGAGSLFELLALKKRTLIIPLPKGNSRGDQIENAEYFSQRGCCHVLYQEKLCKDLLISKLLELENDNNILRSINNIKNIDGTKKIAEIIVSASR